MNCCRGRGSPSQISRSVISRLITSTPDRIIDAGYYPANYCCDFCFRRGNVDSIIRYNPVCRSETSADPGDIFSRFLVRRWPQGVFSSSWHHCIKKRLSLQAHRYWFAIWLCRVSLCYPYHFPASSANMLFSHFCASYVFKIRYSSSLICSFFFSALPSLYPGNRKSFLSVLFQHPARCAHEKAPKNVHPHFSDVIPAFCIPET